MRFLNVTMEESKSVSVSELEEEYSILNDRLLQAEKKEKDVLDKYNKCKQDLNDYITKNGIYNTLNDDLTTYKKLGDKNNSILADKIAGLERIKKENSIHIPDDFGDECVYPDEFFEDLRNIFKKLKFIIEDKKQMCKKVVYSLLKKHNLNVPVNHTIPDSTVTTSVILADIAKTANIDEDNLSVVWTMSTISKVLFQHFELDSFDIISTIIPKYIVPTKRRDHRKSFLDAYHTIKAEKEYEKYPFNKWFDDFKNRLAIEFLQNKEIIEFANKLHDVANDIYALHKLARAYPNIPEIVRIGKDDVMNTKYGKFFIEGLNNENVSFTVFPGFVIDSQIERCYVV